MKVTNLQGPCVRRPGRAKALFRAVWDFLRIVVVDLDRDDDARTIFETLNTRGTCFLPPDLVEN